MYIVEKTKCNCHPETCCCNPWSVVNEYTKETHSTWYHKDDADKIKDFINKDCTCTTELELK